MTSALRLLGHAGRAVLAAIVFGTPLCLYVLGRRSGDMRDRDAPFWERAAGPRPAA